MKRRVSVEIVEIMENTLREHILGLLDCNNSDIDGCRIRPINKIYTAIIKYAEENGINLDEQLNEIDGIRAANAVIALLKERA